VNRLIEEKKLLGSVERAIEGVLGHVRHETGKGNCRTARDCCQVVGLSG
jgi:hypothetical protein